ncbi:outer membrane beta-barrel protein [Dyadobacter sp. 3J3]|uniref:outer membrane beta-barrel protein n=1 Tax=Dyadobacter sp. 3J3 TaxID=2606600 RepID=UPI00135A2F39|nr:outer membrane beta-barrel protein [Dyadobacter sp. 3J3]
MRSIFTLVVILLIVSFATPKVSAQCKFALSATVAPFYVHNKTTATIKDFDNNGVLQTTVYKSSNSWNGSWFGLNGRYSFSSKWSVSTGLWLNESRASSVNSRGRSHSFSIPLMVNFQTSQGKLSPYFSAGALYNFQTISHTYIDDFGSFVFKTGDKTSRISPTVGAGVIYDFTKHLSVIAQPTISYTIPRSGIDSHTYQFLFHIQLLYKL